jgi:iron complex outermembrane recepter protein
MSGTRVNVRNSSRLVASLFLGSVSVFSINAHASAQTAEPEEEAISRLNAVIVTAQRRETTVMDTAETLTAVDADTLQATGGDGIADLSALVPSLAYSENFGISQIFIRGVGNSFFSPGGDPGVALYADGVYLSDQEATGVAFLDVDRIEVLRGPQGALYGRNATGGAVNIVSKRPGSEPELRVSLTGGDFGRREAGAIASGEVAPGLATRLAVQYRQLEGYAKTEFAGGPDSLDGEESISARLTALVDAGGGDLSLTASFFSQDDAGPGL